MIVYIVCTVDYIDIYGIYYMLIWVHSTLSSLYLSLEMEKVGYQKTIQNHNKNLNSKEYKTVDEEYGRQLIKVVTTEQSKKDLANYHTVRDEIPNIMYLAPPHTYTHRHTHTPLSFLL